MMQLTSVPAAARSQGHGTNSCSFAPCSQQVARHMAARNAASDATSRSTGLQKCRAAVRCCHWNQSEAGGQRPLSAKPQRPHRRRRPGGAAQPQALDMQKRELIIGDITCLLCFCFYKQITAIMLLPSFPGVLAPLRFNPVRFEEFASFAATLCGTWVAVALLLGAYRRESTSDIQTAAWQALKTWACSMPIAAAQLVLVTAAEDQTLVGAAGFASALPLAASGPGEPFTTAAGVLGLMAVWRCFYTAYIDVWNFRTPSGARVDRERDGRIFTEALRAAGGLAICFSLAVWVLFRSIDEETAEQALSLMWRQ